MNTNNKYIKYSIFVIIGAAILGLAWFIYYSQYTLNIIRTTPNTNDIATQSPYLTITLNKDIESIDSIVSSPNTKVAESYTFSGKDIIISLEQLDSEEDVSIEFKNIKSVDGYKLSTVLKFTPVTKLDDQLSEEELQGLLEKQDEHTNENADPIQAVVPYSSLNYDLQLTLIGKKPNGGNAYGIDAQIILSSADVKIDEAGATAKYKQEINDYLTSKGIKVEDYPISYFVRKM